jgi:SNF2 family DNA or RNA helicase
MEPVSIDTLVKLKNALSIHLPGMPGFKAEMYPYQQVGVVYLYKAHTTNLFDQCGLGKTVQALGLLELLKQRGELNKALICTPSVLSSRQWARETSRFTSLQPLCAIGDKTDRVSAYGGWYDVLFVTYPILLRDYPYLIELGYNVIIFDEAGYFRNPESKTSDIARQLARGRDWRINMTATPVQNNLQDLHTMFSVIGLESVVGSKTYFWNRHIRSIIIEGFSHTTGRRVRYPKVLGYKNVEELIQRVNPYFLRRTIHDERVEVYLPPLTCTTRHVSMSAELVKEYKRATGKILEDDAAGITPISRMSMHALQKIVDKAKYPALLEMLTQDLAKEKVIVFAWYLPTIADIDKMLTEAGIGHVCITGEGKEDKDVLKQKFENDPSCRVLVGTTAIEMSLNLQIGSYMIALDQFYNPTRTEQLIGRIRRIGSQYNKVVFVQLLVSDDTIEARIPTILEHKSALANYLFSETSEIFPALSKDELRKLIGG